MCADSHIHTNITQQFKKNEILPFATFAMVGIMLSEVSQRQIPYSFTYMCKQLDCNKKY